MLFYRDSIERTALHLAAFKGHEECVRTLLAHVGGPEEMSSILAAEDRDGDTPLLRAALEGHEDCVRTLLAHVRDTTEMTSLLAAKDGYGITALHAAAYIGHDGCVRMLLSHAGGPEQRSTMLAAQDGEGRTAMEVAEEGGEASTARILREAKDEAQTEKVEKEERGLLTGATDLESQLSKKDEEIAALHRAANVAKAQVEEEKHCLLTRATDLESQLMKKEAEIDALHLAASVAKDLKSRLLKKDEEIDALRRMVSAAQAEVEEERQGLLTRTSYLESQLLKKDEEIDALQHAASAAKAGVPEQEMALGAEASSYHDDARWSLISFPCTGSAACAVRRQHPDPWLGLDLDEHSTRHAQKLLDGFGARSLEDLLLGGEEEERLMEDLQKLELKPYQRGKLRAVMGRLRHLRDRLNDFGVRVEPTHVVAGEAVLSELGAGDLDELLRHGDEDDLRSFEAALQLKKLPSARWSQAVESWRKKRSGS